MCDWPLMGRPDSSFGSADDGCTSGTRDSRVEHLSREDPRAWIGEKYRDDFHLGALALVDRQRMHRVHSLESHRAYLYKSSLALENCDLAAVLPGHDHPIVAVVETQAVVVSSHEQWPADIPGIFGEPIELVGE